MENMEIKEKISFSILVYNEASTLKNTIINILDTLNNTHLNFEFWVFDNNSSDETEKIIKQELKNFKINYKKHEKNMGYAFNSYSALKTPDADIYIVMDGDGQYDPNDLKNFILLSKKNDLVIGVRKKRQDPFSRIIMSKIFNIISKIIIKSELRDINCGYKSVSKKLANSLEINYFYNYINPEIYCFAKSKGYSICDLNVNHHKRIGGRSYFTGIFHLVKNVYIMINYLFKLRKKFKNLAFDK